MRVLLYGNGSCGNHGCEAIYRGTINLLGRENQYTLYSSNIEDDKCNGLNLVASLMPARQRPIRDLRFLRAYLRLMAKGDYLELDGLSYLPGIKQAKKNSDIALSVGGDNYCYDGT